MGEPCQDVWWTTLKQRNRQIRTEEEAKYTNERFGSHESLAKRMKERIATEVNNDEISYGEWKKMTKPTTDETCGPSALDTTEAEGPPILSSTASDFATEQKASVEIPQVSLTPNQIKIQRKKEKRREKKAMGTRGKFFPTVTDPSSPSKLTLTEQGNNELADSTTINHENENANTPMWKRITEKDKKNSEDVLVSSSPANQSSSSNIIINRGKGKGKRLKPDPFYEFAKDEGKSAYQNLPNKKVDQSIDLSNVTDQSVESSGIPLDEGKGSPLGNLAARNIKPLDIALDQGKAQSSSSVPAQNVKPLEVTHGGGNEALSGKPTAQNDSPLGIALDEGNESLSSKATGQNDPPLDITFDEGADASPSMIAAQNITPSEITLVRERESSPSNLTAQDSIRVSITIDTGDRKVSISALLKRQTDRSIDAAGTQTTLPLDITLDTGTGERSITALLDEQIGQSIGVMSNPSIDLTNNLSNQNTHQIRIILEEKPENTPINALPDEKLDQNINTVSKTQNSARRVFKTLSHNPGGKSSVIGLTAKTDPSVDFARKVVIPKEKHHDNLENTRKEKPLLENLSGKENDHGMDLANAQHEKPSDITLTNELKAKIPIKALYDEKNNQGIDTASKAHNHMLHAHESSSNSSKGMTLTINQSDQSDPSIIVTGKNIAQNRKPSKIIIDEGQGKGPAEKSTNISADQSIGTACKRKTKLVYIDQTLPIREDGKAMVDYLADKMMAEGSNAASKETTHEGRGSEASHSKSQGKAQASNFTFGKTGQNVGSSSSLSTHHQPASFLPRPPPASACRARGWKWAYITHTKADEALIEQGIWLFEKPQTYFEYQSYHYVRRGSGLNLAPIAVATYEEDDVHEPHEPSIDVDNVGVWINTHDVPWRDVRSKVTHPDFQPTPKLLEYQACESLGIAVWRHDRNLLNCRLQGCKVKIADQNPSTVICLGCGPKTITRYCSVAHQIADLREHWEECGQSELFMRRVIDNTTSPARFGCLWPAIRDRSGHASYERSRQAIYAALQHGRYTLFDPESEVPTALIWPREDGRAAIMERRVERLLNYALFDHKHGRITGLLYRMIRQCLIQKNFWAIGPIHAVKTQFAAEFGCDVSKVAEQALCECEWWGARLPSNRHVAGCKRLYLAYSVEYQTTGIQGFLEMMESRYWALRAWRQRHPTVDDWNARVSGCGFAGEISGAAPFLGPGWVGWGSPADDLVD